MREVLARGGTTDDGLAALRASGAGMIDSIKVVVEVHGASLGQAKWVVDGSRAWADGQQDRQAFRDRIVEELLALDDPDVTVTLTDDEVDVAANLTLEEPANWTLGDSGVPDARLENEPSDWPALDVFERAVTDMRPQVETEGITVEFHRPTARYDKAVAWVDLASTTMLAQVIVWETGESDVLTGSLEGQAVVDQRSLILRDKTELYSLLAETVGLLRA